MAGKNPYQLAVQLYTLRDSMKTPKDIAKTFQRVRKIGYRNVQVCGSDSISAMEVKEMADAAGLTIIGAHIGVTAFEADINNVIDQLHTWNCSYVAIPWLDSTKINTAALWKKTAKEFNKYGKILAAEGITLQYHNHHFEFQKYAGRTALEILYAESDPKYLQAELDTCWVARGGGEPTAWIRSLKGRIDQIHFKDMLILDREPIFAEIGEGNLYWEGILAACKYAKVKDFIVEQDSCPVTKDPFKSIEISYKNLCKMGLK
jgi:sugar phosphate isomerase/epimerase